MNEPDWTTHITAGAAWKRFGIMIVCIPILACVGFFIAFTALFQFFNVLAQGEPNPHLGRNGRDLGRYALGIIDFLTYNSEKLPFPFSASDETDTEPAPQAAPPKPATPRKKTTTRKKTATTRKKTTTRSSTSRKKTTTKKTSESRAPKPGEEQPGTDKPSG